MVLGAFDSFSNFISQRAAAAVQHAFADGNPQLGALILLGQEEDAELLKMLAVVATSIDGARLKSVSNKSRTEAGSAQDSEVVICKCSQGSSLQVPPASSSDRSASIYVHRAGVDRNPSACDATSHEFEVIGNNDVEIAKHFRRLVKVLRCKPEPCLGPGTYFCSLTFPDVSTAMSQGHEWKPPEWVVQAKGNRPLHDALEVRADLLKSKDAAFVLSQLAIVRTHSEGLPIIFTVRSKAQGGAFPDDEEAAWKLTMVGLRFGVEYLDVEAGWSREGRHAFLQMVKRTHPGIRIIGSYHAIQHPVTAMDDHDLCALFRECAHGPDGAVDIVKVVGRADTAQCSIRVNQCAMQMRNVLPRSVHSIIAICTSEAGRLSRALNIMLGPTPVAHPALPAVAAPGQLSACEIEQIRHTLGLEANPFRKA